MPTAKSISQMFEQKAFVCPHCSAYSNQTWCQIYFMGQDTNKHVEYNQPSYFGSICDHCNKAAIWLDYQQLAYPSRKNIPLPSTDIPEILKSDYMEAREIAEKSPRSAAALLRLLIQKLMPFLGQKGKNINEDIAELVKEGLPLRIQQSLDLVRVIGNNAVHPGEIDLTDDVDTAKALFQLTNMIIDTMITQPKKILELYKSLPQRDLINIDKRDKK